MTTRTCENCGKEFDGAPQARFDSAACQKAFRRKQGSDLATDPAPAAGPRKPVLSDEPLPDDIARVWVIGKRPQDEALARVLIAGWGPERFRGSEIHRQASRPPKPPVSPSLFRDLAERAAGK